MFTTDRVNAYFFLYIWVFSRFAIYGFTASAVTSFSASDGAGSQCAATLVVPLLVPHMGCIIIRGQQRHCILHKCIARFVSDN